MPLPVLLTMASSGLAVLRTLLRDPAVQRKILAAVVRRLARGL